MNSPLNSTSVVDLIKAETGLSVVPLHQRFSSQGWIFQGVTDEIRCGDCGGPFRIYRKPYTTNRGSYRYWAIACLGCKDVSALDDFESESHKAFREWSDQLNKGTPGSEVNTSPHDLSKDTPEVLASKIPATERSEEPSGSRAHQSEPDVKGPLRLARAASQLELDATEGAKRTQDIGSLEPLKTDVNTFEVKGPQVDLSEQPPGEVFIQSSEDGATISCVVKFASATQIMVEVEPGTIVPGGSRLCFSIDPSQVPKAFKDFLESMNEAGFGSVFGGRSALVDSPEFAIGGLNEEQRKAAGQVIGPGVSAIWGPPGTGKTRVIGSAVSQLLKENKTVCVVSNTNVAVDQAILRVVDSYGKFDPGQILRIGNPSMPEIGEHGHLTVRQAAELRCAAEIEKLAEKTEELDALQLEMSEMAGGTGRDALANLNKEALELLVQRRQQLADKAILDGRITDTLKELTFLEQEAETSQRVLDTANAAAEAYRSFEWVIEADRKRKETSLRLKHSAENLADLDKQAQATGEGFFGRHEKRNLERKQQQARSHHKALNSELASLELELETASATGATPAHLRKVFEDERAKAEHCFELKMRIELLNSQIKSATNELETIGNPQELSGSERKTLNLVDCVGSVELLVAKSQDLGRRILALRDEIDSIRRKISGAEDDLIRDSKIVGTTLAQLVLHKGLKARTFDHVVVDEVSAALAHTAFVAASKSTVGCTFVGDFEQNWPITRVQESSDMDPELRPWLFDNPFSLLGISSADDAERTNGCTVLRRQYRFGPHTTQLANEIAYKGTLIGNKPRQPDDWDEIVFIDTSEFRNEGFVNKGPRGSGRYWGLGAAISVEIARDHDFHGVGVVTPYRLQSQLTKSQMIDHGAFEVQVGTVHSFQGREFPTIVFDLVEDGAGWSWVARSRRDGNNFEQAGARLFTVAATRTKGQLYFIGNLAAIKAAKLGPFTHLNQLLEEGKINVRSAMALINRNEIVGHPPPHESAFQGEGFFEHSHSRLLDGEDFYGQLLRDISSARHRCVIFSPFVSHNRISFLAPHLESAISRGVKVTCFTKSASELREPDILEGLQRIGVRVREIPGMHYKVVILDECISFVGSLNTLSYTGRTGEVMMRLVGTETTERIVQWMRSIR